MSFLWTTFFPYAAEVPARRGGVWKLTVAPEPSRIGWTWRVGHSADAIPRGTGAASTPNFAKHQAEAAVAELDVDAL